MKEIFQLLVIVWLGIFAYLLFPANNLVRLLIVIIITLIFIVWGLKQHLTNKTLNYKIILEYVLLGLLGIALVIFLLYHD